MEFFVVIPARYGSRRLPGKPLSDMHGKPLIRHVWENAVVSGAARVWVATDDERVADVARGFGADVCMTGRDHISGTSRITEVVEMNSLPAQALIVNVQGDEPLLPPALIRQVARLLNECPSADMSTLYEPFDDPKAALSPHAVKLVHDINGRVLYFSRAVIPWSAAGHTTWLRHIGLYAYRAEFLRRLRTWPAVALEQSEDLEQLRVLYHGGVIYAAPAVATPGPGVDTEEDLEQARAWRPEASGT